MPTHPFHDRIHPRRLNRSTDYPGANGTEDLIERGGEAGVPVMQEELHSHRDILQVHEQVPGLLDHPRMDRVLGGSEDVHPAGAVLNNGKDVDLRSVEQVGGEQFQRRDPLRLGPQELGPTSPAATRPGNDQEGERQAHKPRSSTSGRAKTGPAHAERSTVLCRAFTQVAQVSASSGRMRSAGLVRLMPGCMTNSIHG